MLQSVSQTKTLRIESHQATKSNPNIKRRILSLRGAKQTAGVATATVFLKSHKKKRMLTYTVIPRKMKKILSHVITWMKRIRSQVHPPQILIMMLSAQTPANKTYLI